MDTRKIFKILTNLPPPSEGWRTRFAPSPTGHLHLGHVASALIVWLVAKVMQGEVFLRMEDHDRQRSQKLYEESIITDLLWLGLVPDDGVRASHEKSVFRQSDCNGRYQAQIQMLTSKNMLYNCCCSRRQIKLRSVGSSPELWYDGHCRNLGLSPSITTSLRMIMPDKEVCFQDARFGEVCQIPAKQCGDMALKDQHGDWTYQFAVTADDIHQRINLVVRGEDILASTARQIMLRKNLGSGIEITYFHHGLILDDFGKKLSKRLHSTAIQHLRNQGHSAMDLIGEVAYQAGLFPKKQKLSFKELLDFYRE